MGTGRLYIFVEGADDERFFGKVILPLFEDKCSVKIIEWRRMKMEKIRGFVRSIESMDAEYIFVCDIDHFKTPEEKREYIKRKIENLRHEKIAVVVKEIESWYLAGLDEAASEELGIKVFETTDEITKETFNSLIPQRFKPRTYFMMEILKRYSVEVAMRKNRSFREFVERFLK